MKHRFFAISSGLSLLIAITAMVAWAESGFILWRGVYESTHWGAQTDATDGEFVIHIYYGSHVMMGWRYDILEKPSAPWFHDMAGYLAGFGYGSFYIYPMNVISFACPLWFIAAMASILPVRFVISHRKVQKIRSRLCVSCGYDLRASKGTCPECGTAIPQLKG